VPYMQSRGDYLGGGYQRGDPGFFGSLGGLLKKGIGFATSIGLGGPVGVAVGRAFPTRPAPGTVAGPAGFQQIPSPRVSQQAAAGGRGQQAAVQQVGPDGCAPRGYHLAKDGSGRMVKNRSMNVANPRALRRAIRREQGFVKLAQRSLKGTGYKIARR